MNTDTGMPPSHSGGRKSGSTIRFTLTGLILFCASLVATSILATHYMEGRNQGTVAKGPDIAAAGVPKTSAATDSPWGDLLTMDVDIQQPAEYVSFDTTSGSNPQWTFPGRTENQIREQLAQCGMTDAQIKASLAPDKVVSRADATVLNPDASLIISLAPETRSKLYGVLGNWPENKLMCAPYHLPGAFEVMAAKSGVSPKVIELIGKLTYQSAGVDLFSDPEVVLASIPSAEERLHVMIALTYQTAVLARLHLTKDSDIDKIVGYWGAVPGVRDKDLRPLLDSIARTPEGGTISLLYLLPQFARERLFTFPMPTQSGDPRMDCHWTALNFLNSTPDDRLQDTAYASNYIKENFYQIGKPSKCGDLVFLLDAKGGVIHSAVFIADDIVFTKNGVNYAQPWILMRMKNLLNAYTRTEIPKVLYYRRKET
jgi:hypothetical protein